MIKVLINSITVLAVIVSIFGFTYSTGMDTGIKEEFLRKYQESNTKINSIESDFVQKHHMQIMEKPIISTGKFHYKKPGLMKWDQQTPQPYYFIVKGDKVIRYDGKKRKEISANNPQVSYFKNFILGTVDGSLFESQQFDSDYFKEDGIYVITLSPKEKTMQKRIEKIILLFDVKTLALSQLKLIEPEGDFMLITFMNQKFNSIQGTEIFN